jgi:hypothetical protein
MALVLPKELCGQDKGNQSTLVSCVGLLAGCQVLYTIARALDFLWELMNLIAGQRADFLQHFMGLQGHFLVTELVPLWDVCLS